MSKNRRTFSKDFKAKVVLEALKEQSSLEALAKKYELLPNQISTWKTEAIKNISAVFSTDTKNTDNEHSTEKLYAQIGQLKVENDFLKKKLR